MKVIKGLTIKQLMEYEAIKGVNALNKLENYDIEIICDIIKMSNNIDDDKCEEYVTSQIKEHGLMEFTILLFEDIFGRITHSNNNNVEIKERSFTELFNDFYNEIQAYDSSLSYSDFCGMNTLFMYKYCDGIKTRYIHNKNEQLRNNYEQAAMILSGLAGKLKDCPQLDEETGKQKKKSAKELADMLRAQRNKQLNMLKEQGLINM